MLTFARRLTPLARTPALPGPAACAVPALLAVLAVLAVLAAFPVPLRAAEGDRTSMAVPKPPPPPREQVLKLGYEVYLGGLNIFAFTTDLALANETYSIKGSGESRGAIRLFWRWAAGLVAGGTIGADGVQAQIYNVHTYRPDRDRSMQLSFDEDGQYTIRRTPPDTEFRASKRQLPVIVPSRTVDPLSVALAIAHNVENGKGCKGTYPIFDGNRRYNLIFNDLGPDAIPPTPYSVFAGTARRCQFDMQRISGFREPRVYVRYWDEDNLDPPEVWVARLVPDMPPVPVRLQGTLNMGGLRIYLVWAEYGGKPLFPNGQKPELSQVRGE